MKSENYNLEITKVWLDWTQGQVANAALGGNIRNEKGKPKIPNRVKEIKLKYNNITYEASLGDNGRIAFSVKGGDKSIKMKFINAVKNANQIQTEKISIDVEISWEESDEPLNLILYGPPGTGKTYTAIERAVKIIDYKKWGEAKSNGGQREQIKILFDEFRKEGQIEFITFHQSYSYEEFIVGIKPEIVGIKPEVDVNIEGNNSSNSVNAKERTSTEIKYKVQPGIFNKFSEKAKKNWEDKKFEKHVLIIDEINRGNITQIFGELITLIEKNKRLGEDEALEVKLPYSVKPDERFVVPPNLYIIATMNTADRSVEALDTALRRRFHFEEITADLKQIPKTISYEDSNLELRDIFEAINKRIKLLKDKDHQIGHEYLMYCKTIYDVIEAFQYKIMPLLKEYFYSDYSNINKVLGNCGFITIKDKKNILFPSQLYKLNSEELEDKYDFKDLTNIQEMEIITSFNKIAEK